MSNLNYERNDENADPVVPQPPFEEITADPTTGMITSPYRNYNQEYRAIGDDDLDRTPGTYQRIDDDDTAVTPAQYQRYDDDDNLVTPATYIKTPDEP